MKTRYIPGELPPEAAEQERYLLGQLRELATEYAARAAKIRAELRSLDELRGPMTLCIVAQSRKDDRLIRRIFARRPHGTTVPSPS